jgi:hypothetical protein
MSPPTPPPTIGHTRILFSVWGLRPGTARPGARGSERGAVRGSRVAPNPRRPGRRTPRPVRDDFRRRRVTRAAFLAAAALPGAPPLLAHAGGAPPAAGAGFPEPFGLALLAMVAAGALGALTADLVPDGRRLERWRRGAQGWTLGVLGKLIVGSVAAVVLLTLNPPAGAWAPLVATALVGGLGGEAMLVAVVSARKAQDAEKDREALCGELARRRAEALEKVESVGALAIAAHRDRRVRLERLRIAGALGDGGAEAASGEDASFERLVHTAVERAKAELSAG